MNTSILLISFIISFTTLAQNDADYKKAINFRLESTNNDVFELKDFIGRGPVLLCFWSVCCQSAAEQLKAFSTLFNNYKDRGFILLAISTDDEKTIAKVKPYTKSKGYNFPVLYDAASNVARMYYAYDNPFSVLINKEGNVVYSKLGYMKGDENEMQRRIIEYLEE